MRQKDNIDINLFKYKNNNCNVTYYVTYRRLINKVNIIRIMEIRYKINKYIVELVVKYLLMVTSRTELSQNIF